MKESFLAFAKQIPTGKLIALGVIIFWACVIVGFGLYFIPFVTFWLIVAIIAIVSIGWALYKLDLIDDY